MTRAAADSRHERSSAIGEEGDRLDDGLEILVEFESERERRRSQ
jgi:hypothetical protein